MTAWHNRRGSPAMPLPLYPLYDILVRSYRAAFHRAHPLCGAKRFDPVFVVGSGRSGNTLFRRMLQAGPDLHIPPETFVLGRAIRLYLRNRHMPWDYLVRLVLGLFEYHREFDKFGISTRAIAPQLLDAPPPMRSLAMVLNAFYRHHAGMTGKACVRWGDKTPHNTFSLELLLKTFPDARFVHVMRDGADVVHSFVVAGLQPDLAAAARRWVEAMDAARRFAARHPSRCTEVRYETLVRSPEASLATVCAFLDIGYDSGMVTRLEHVPEMGDVGTYGHMKNVAGPVSTASLGRGRSSLSDSERRDLGGIMDKTLAACGYEPLA